MTIEEKNTMKEIKNNLRIILHTNQKLEINNTTMLIM